MTDPLEPTLTTQVPCQPLTFKSEKERQRAFDIIWKLQKSCTTDTRYRIYAEREREIRIAPVVP